MCALQQHRMKVEPKQTDHKEGRKLLKKTRKEKKRKEKEKKQGKKRPRHVGRGDDKQMTVKEEVNKTSERKIRERN